MLALKQALVVVNAHVSYVPGDRAETRRDLGLCHGQHCWTLRYLLFDYTAISAFFVSRTEMIFTPDVSE